MNNVSHSLGRSVAVIMLIASLMPLGGCRICATCDELDYAAYGGAWERTRRDAGRVGSILDPAGGRVAELVDRDQPPHADERQRQQSADSESSTDSDPDNNDDDDPQTDQAGRSGGDSGDDEEAGRAKNLENRLKDLENLELEEIKTLDKAPLPELR